MIGLLMDRTAEVLRPAATGYDRFGNRTAELVLVASHRCRLEQTSTREDDTDSYEVAAWRGFFPGDADIRSGDELRADGLVFTVEGTPSAQTVPGAPFLDHVLVALRQVREVA